MFQAYLKTFCLSFEFEPLKELTKIKFIIPIDNEVDLELLNHFIISPKSYISLQLISKIDIWILESDYHKF